MNLYEIKYDRNDKGNDCLYVVAHSLEDAWVRFLKLYKPTDSPPVCPQVTQVSPTGRSVVLLSDKVVAQLVAENQPKEKEGK